MKTSDMTERVIWILTVTVILCVFNRVSGIQHNNCVSWRDDLLTLTITCRVPNFSEPITISHEKSKLLLNCSIVPENTSCYPSQKNITVDRHNHTVSMQFIEYKRNAPLEGEWQCKQGKSVLYTNVSFSEGTISDSWIQIQGKIDSYNDRRKNIIVECSSCRKPESNYVEFLVNNKSIGSMWQHKFDGVCRYKRKKCNPVTCNCSSSGNMFSLRLPLTDDIKEIACEMQFKDDFRNGKYRTISSMSITGEDVIYGAPITYILVKNENKHAIVDPTTSVTSDKPIINMTSNINHSSKGLPTTLIIVIIVCTVFVVTALMVCVKLQYRLQNGKEGKRKTKVTTRDKIQKRKRSFSCIMEGEIKKPGERQDNVSTPLLSDGRKQTDECLENETSDLHEGGRMKTEERPEYKDSKLHEVVKMKTVECPERIISPLREDGKQQTDEYLENETSDLHEGGRKKTEERPEYKNSKLHEDGKMRTNECPESEIAPLHEDNKSLEKEKEELCEICKRTNQTLFCLNCQRKLCTACRPMHDRFGLSTHTIVRIQDVPPSFSLSLFCQHHTNNELKQVCIKNEEVLCAKCADCGHSGCKLELLENHVVKNNYYQIAKFEGRELKRALEEREIRVALVGRTGVGKSSTANTICGEKLFKSGIKASSMTKICQESKADVQGKSVLLIDTPGVFDTEEAPDIVEEEIKRCVHLGAPGLHAILFIMDIKRFRDEDIETIRTFLKFFDKDLLRYVIVVFTHGDKLVKENITLEQFLQDAPMSVNEFLRQCDNRIVLFNNELSHNDSIEQISLLLTMVESLKQTNEMKYYSDAVFKDAEKHVQKREKEIKDQLAEMYETRQKDFERTLTVALQGEMQKEREEEMFMLKKQYEDQLTKVRDEIRKEIAKEKTMCTIS